LTAGAAAVAAAQGRWLEFAGWSMILAAPAAGLALFLSPTTARLFTAKYRFSLTETIGPRPHVSWRDETLGKLLMFLFGLGVFLVVVAVIGADDFSEAP
jgi:hypothetical protein